jgi:hypothetical protein
LSQIILKANMTKPYTRNSFSFKLLFVVTARSHMRTLWFQECMQTSKESKTAFAEMPIDSFPDVQLMTKESLIQSFLLRYKASEVGPEYVGRHRIPGFAWPPLECHDRNHNHLMSESPRRCPALHARQSVLTLSSLCIHRLTAHPGVHRG